MDLALPCRLWLAGLQGGKLYLLSTRSSQFPLLEAQKQYNEFMIDYSVDKAQNTKDIEHKSKGSISIKHTKLQT